MEVGCAVFDVTAGFFSSRVQRVVVDGIRNENASVFFCVLHGSVLGPLLLLPYTCDLPIIIDSTLLLVMQLTLFC